LKSASRENAIEENRIVRNGRGISLLGSGDNLLLGNSMEDNRYAVRVDREDPSRWDDGPFRQDFDTSNTIDARPVCYVVDGRDMRLGEDCALIALVGCSNVTAEDLTLSNNTAGALIVNSTGSLLRNITFSGNEFGARLLKTSGSRIEDSRADDSAVGFLVERGQADEIFGCTANGSSGSGFDIQGSSGVVLKGSTASENRVGISVSNSSSTMIIQSMARENEEEGISLTRSHRSVLSQNSVSGNREGIRAAGSDGTVAIRNDLFENEGAGLALHQLSAATVTGNAARGNGDGVTLSSVDGARIESNDLRENRRYGLRVSYSRDGTVAENTFFGNGLCGASLVDSSGFSIRHNNFIDNGSPMLPQNAVDNGANEWDGGAEVGGNFWSDHPTVGNPGSDPRRVPSKGTDRYPYQDPDGWKGPR